MYIELFLLDNALMDWLILRLAAALRGGRLAKGRAAAGCVLGALYALWAVFWPPAGGILGKIAFGGVLALALSPKSYKEYGLAVLCLFAAAFAVGGMAFALALATGGRVERGVIWTGLPVRTALCIALLATFLPGAARRILRRKQAGRVRLTVAHGGASYALEGLVDSGSSLYDPLSGLPVVVAYLPALAAEARLPVPVETLGGKGVLFALKPQHITWNGTELNALLAISPSPLRGAQALIPPAALPIETGE